MFTVQFDTRNEATQAYDDLMVIVDLYGFATANDLLDICGSSRISYQGKEYGWTTKEISKARVEIRHDNKYELVLPNPVNLEDRARLDFVNAQARNVACSSNKDRPTISYRSYYSKPDPVNHPEHYKAENGLEVIDVIEAFTQDLTGMEAVCTANAIKYILRWKHKNGVEDLKKARWYISKLIDEKENEDE